MFTIERIFSSEKNEDVGNVEVDEGFLAGGGFAEAEGFLVVMVAISPEGGVR